MRWKLAFGLASDDLFFVTMRRDGIEAAGHPVPSKITTFFDEDEFLGHLIRAGLGEESTACLAKAVLLSVAKPLSPPSWTAIDLTQRQIELLHLGSAPPAELETDPSFAKDFYLQAARSGSLPQFYDLLMQAPTALSMLTGAQHLYSFLNDRYARLIGISSPARVLGTSALDRYTGEQRKMVADVLDRVYRTGKTYVGTETPRSFFHENSATFKELYFNTVCQPIANAFGEVAGIMVQTTDVTEIVLARAAQETREHLLYRQWAELEAIYASAPLALFVVDAADYRILRLNDNQARIFGGSVAALTGRPLMGYLRDPARIAAIFARVRAGETVRNQIIERDSAETPGVPRCWLSNFSPMFSAERNVEAITVIAFEITAEVRMQIEITPETELISV